jgi:hypothetical protein
MKSEQEIRELASKIYKEEFEGEPLNDTTVIDGIVIGYQKSQAENVENKIKLAALLRELFSSIKYSSNKYDELLKELYK